MYKRQGVGRSFRASRDIDRCSAKAIEKNRTMASFTLRVGFGALIAAAGVLGASRARAEITFCNKFGHVVNVAIAYPQTDGSFLSRGWMSLSDGACAPFDTAIHVKTFYFRGESVSYRDKDGRMTRDF